MADAMDKIRKKGAAKDYKAGPGLVGRPRLEQRLRKLIIEAHRFALKNPGPDAYWAMQVADALRQLVRKA